MKNNIISSNQSLRKTVYLGITYVIKSIEEDGLFLVDAYDEYSTGNRRLRLSRHLAKFATGTIPQQMNVGAELYDVEAYSIVNKKGQSVLAIRDYSLTKRKIV